MGLLSSWSCRSCRRDSVIYSDMGVRVKPEDGVSTRLNELCAEGVKLNDFQVLNSELGDGRFATVMKVRHMKSRRLYACKVLRKPQLLRERQVVNIFIERGILIRLHHPFVVSLHYAFQTEEKLFLVMDYCAGGDFFHHLQAHERFSEHVTAFYAAEICLGLEALHNLDIIHRDLKPENILVTASGHLKLTDFGFSKWGDNRQNQELSATTFLGSAPYLAPEILENKEYTKAVDWWAFGILICEMITGRPQFYEQNIENNYKRIVHESVAFKEYLSRPVRSIILDLLEKDPMNRLREAVNVKEHAFFRRTNWEGLLNLTIKPPKDVEILRLTDSEEESTFVELMCDYYQPSYKIKEKPRDASLKIRGDPFSGFTYSGASSQDEYKNSEKIQTRLNI